MAKPMSKHLNLRGIIQGHADTPLNAQGRIESVLLAEHLKGFSFVEVWSSDLSGTHETAKIVTAHHISLSWL
ncbi:MAG: hypothetical protein TREMPRED_005533 [Tremellales sp. Tagirdzhanova-0007]|nr:MAG: hypothetical protein TREMPRED_005533 [Tremellales sp. Tagirdzhanova-0007]